MFTGTVIYQELPAATKELTHRFLERIEAAEELVRELTTREQELRGELAARVARCDELERQLSEVRAQMAQESAAALRERTAGLRHDRDEGVDRVAELRAELVTVVSRRQEAERQVEQAQADQTRLDTFFGSVEDLLHLNFTRAEEERREKERLLAECTALREKVETLQRTLALYQAH